MIRDTNGRERNPRFDGLRWAFFGSMACLLITLLGMRTFGLTESVMGTPLPIPGRALAATTVMTAGMAMPPSGDAAAVPLINSPEITLDEFDRIETGMTESEVTAIVGDAGQLLVDNGTGIYRTVMRLYPGADTARATATFVDGRLTNKAQLGLR